MIIRNLFSILILVSYIFSSDNRSTIYYNGNPSGVETYNLVYKTDSTDYQFSNRFIVNNDYILERFSFYFSFLEYPDSIMVILQENENESPGNIIGEWPVTINQNYPNGSGYNIFTLDEFIQLDIDQTYWVTALSRGNGILKWNHTDENWPNISSFNGGLSWSDVSLSPPGASIVYGETIYYQDPIWGDVNDDLIQNVVDIIQMVQFVMEELNLSENQIYKADINQDGEVNVIDILGVVNIILNTTPPMVTWLLENINTFSPSFEELIGPSTYNGNISLYYFGKAG